MVKKMAENKKKTIKNGTLTDCNIKSEKLKLLEWI